MKHFSTENKSQKDISRRDFLKIAGAAGVAVGGTALVGCKSRNTSSVEGGNLDGTAANQMTYRITPNSGDKVSLLGFGCMRWPLRQNAAGEDEVDQDAVNEMVDYAIEHGVNFFDTAPPYVRGWSEKSTGIALKRHPRDKFFIATKLSNHRGSPTLEAGMAMYHKSMEDLQVDYLDYYFLHSIGSSIENYHQRFVDNKLLDFLLEERKAGRIRNLGWSFHGNQETFDYILAQHDQYNWDFVMIQMNPMDWQNAPVDRTINAEYLYKELTKKGIPVIVMSPLSGGRLSQLPEPALQLLKQVNPNSTPSEWMLRFSGGKENVLTILSGMTYLEHVQENVRTYSPLKPLSEKESNTLDIIVRSLVDSDFINCPECQYCMPCPYGLDIPEIFSHFNRTITAGNLLKSSNDENFRKARRQFLIGYDRRVEKFRQADHCIECNLCVPKCPQNIDIPKEMRRVHTYAEKLRQGVEF